MDPAMAARRFAACWRHGNSCIECGGAGAHPGGIYDPSAPLDGGTAVRERVQRLRQHLQGDEVAQPGRRGADYFVGRDAGGTSLLRR
jgi:hypothetical protein